MKSHLLDHLVVLGKGSPGKLHLYGNCHSRTSFGATDSNTLHHYSMNRERFAICATDCVSGFMESQVSEARPGHPSWIQAGTRPFVAGAFANICLMPRSAWRVRSSFSMSEKRTWVSP